MEPARAIEAQDCLKLLKIYSEQISAEVIPPKITRTWLLLASMNCNVLDSNAPVTLAPALVSMEQTFQLKMKKSSTG